RQAFRRDRLHGRCDQLHLAGGTMAEFDPRADGAQAGLHGASIRGRPDCAGGLRNPAGAGSASWRGEVAPASRGPGRAPSRPRRVSNVLGTIAAAALFWSVISGVLFRVALRIADASFQEYDELIEPESLRPILAKPAAALLCWFGRSSDGPDGSSSPRGRGAR